MRAVGQAMQLFGWIGEFAGGQTQYVGEEA